MQSCGNIKYVLMLLILCIFSKAGAQNEPTTQQIRQQMAKIRQTTNWDDPAAAKKANEDIQKLARQMTGDKSLPSQSFGLKPDQKTKSIADRSVVKYEVTRENVVAIASRLYNRSYRTLDIISKTQFDQDYKKASDEKFKIEAVRRLTTIGGILISIGDNHNQACVYLASAVMVMPTDTLSINNFGAYLRIIDSVRTSIPVLLYANTLFSKSPIVLTQIGCSYFELNDQKQAEFYLKEALKNKPDFGQAHTALCELYIKQNRLEDAILELFAGVKGMGCSYNRASGNFAYLKQQAGKSGGNGNFKSTDAFWDETGRQVSPEDDLVQLVPEDNHLKIPEFPDCLRVEDWVVGGGYIAAADAYKNRFMTRLIAFNKQFKQVHEQSPSISPNAVLRDYSSERFALDCITEYFFHESKKESKRYKDDLYEILMHANEDADIYMQKHMQYVKQLTGCNDGCNFDEYCIDECHRKYCQNECPAAIEYNTKLQKSFDDFRKAFRQTVNNQKKILDDLYGFTPQWFSRLQSPYWSKIYAYEIDRVALTIIGNCYIGYAQPFLQPANNDCGTDCSLFANPYPIPPEELKLKDPKGNTFPEDKKATVGLLICSLAFDCESVEFGCAEGAAFSIKRNFKNKSTTAFIGVGAEAGVGFARAEATAGFTMTQYANGDIDVGAKAEVTGSMHGPVSVGKNYEVTATVMEGVRTESKDVIGF